MVAWARKYGIQSTIHTGGPSIPGSGLIDKDVVLEADADIIGHINGGHTSLPERARLRAVREVAAARIEIVHNGNERVALAAAQRRARAQVPAPRHPRHRRPGRLGRAAARHPAHDRDAVQPRRHPGRAGFLLRDRQHGAHPRSRLRADRGRPRRRLRVPGPRAAHGRQARCSRACSSATCRASAW